MIVPLKTVQFQICEAWNIPYLDVSGIPPPAIASKLDEVCPRVLLMSIEDASNRQVQAQIQGLKVLYVAIDECQVRT